MTVDRRPHAVAWWMWAAGMSVAAMRLSNPIVMLGLGVVVVTVALLRQAQAPWGRTLGVFIKLGLMVIILRILFQIIFGQRIPGHVLFTLPSLPLPGWAEGVSLGGPVTVEALIVAAIAGLRLALILICFGAANAIASPRELLRSLPGVFNEIAVAVTVGLCFLPELMAAVVRIRSARKLRGRPTRGFSGIRGITVPVLEDALEHSMDLACSMGARGFGRTGKRSSLLRNVLCGMSAALGTLCLLLGTYGILAPQSGVPFAPILGGIGLVLLASGVLASGRRAERTRYRPTPFGLRSLTCGLSGWFVIVALSIIGIADPAAISYTPYPLIWPAVPLWALASVAVGLLPLLVAPGVAHARSQDRSDLREKAAA